jgi:hypothetical protein
LQKLARKKKKKKGPVESVPKATLVPMTRLYLIRAFGTPLRLEVLKLEVLRLEVLNLRLRPTPLLRGARRQRKRSVCQRTNDRMLLVLSVQSLVYHDMFNV